MRISVFAALVLLSTTLAGSPVMAATLQEKPMTEADIKAVKSSVDVNDPWEGFNHAVFDFNLGFDRTISKPVIKLYDNVPHDIRRDISNALTNLGEPLNFIHGILQINPKMAFTSLWRFILNSTFGLAGTHDFARIVGNLHNTDQNLGKTLGYWGVDAGPYLVLPILGPSSARDTTGKVGDWFMDPVGWEETTWESAGQGVADGIDTRDSKAGVVEHLYYQSLDPYVATRSAYRQHEAYTAPSRE